MTTGLLAALCASALTIFPTAIRDREPDPAAGPARGVESSIRDVRVTPEARAAATDLFADQRRIAVLPFTASKGDPGAALSALGCSEAMTADLHYVTGFLVLERAEVLHAYRGRGRERRPLAPLEIGRKLGVRYVITGMLVREADDERLDAEAIEIGPDDTSPRPPVKATARRPGGQATELADEVLLNLLGQLNAKPAPERITEMTKVQTPSDSARALCDDGFATMDRASGISRGDDPALSARALKESEAAMKADPRYLRAALLQAGCLLRLGEIVRLESCLTQASNLQVPETRIDVLTRLELDGDHAVFVKRDFENAVRCYRKMLEIDPGHPRALWMLTALYSGEFESPQWAGQDLDQARDYAARLLAAHPDSAAAGLFDAPKP
jgi:TolB-like protein